jgi:hypothetical protein
LLPSGADPSGAVWVDTEVVDGRDMIRFDSPNPPLLVAARRAIRRAALLEMVSEMYSRNPRPLDYFSPGEGADPADDDEIAEILAKWAAARADGSTAYVPHSLEYHSVDVPSPADMQLIGQQARAALDLANAMGIDPEDLGINVTSRTYQNVTDRRIDRINDVTGPYMTAITDRLNMPDVTRRGYTVDYDLTRYLRADPTTAATVSSTLSTLRAITTDEIRARNGLPPLTPAQKSELTQKPAPAAPASAPDSQGVPVLSQNSAPVRAHFSLASTHFAFVDGDAPIEFRANAEKRTVSGMLLPFGPVGHNGSGRWRFAAGSVEWNKSAVSRVKLNREHERAALLGAATEVKASDAGISAVFKVGRSAPGDEALNLAEDGALDGLSAEVDVLDYTTDPVDSSVFLVTKARLTGAALTATPAFDDARLTSVAASAHEGNTPMKCSTCGLDHAPGTPCATVPAPAPATFTAEQLAAIGQAAATALAAEGGPAVVNPRRTASLSVTRNPLPYAFNGHRSEHEFSTDVIAALRHDGEAKARLDGFMRLAFVDDVSTGDVNELNPTRNRPDLYVDERDFANPVWAAINKGTLADITPFTIPQFGSATTVVSDHSEGTEPTAGVFTTTGQTITPTAVSGKFEITREVIDQGGNPQASTIMWRKIVRAYNEALEVKAVAMLDALSPTAIALNGIDADLDQDLTANLALLQYVRGGNHFGDFVVASDLFTALISAVDDNGRRLYPVVNPSNASGQSAPNAAYVQTGSLRAVPAWALEAANGGDGSSYLFDSGDVHGWASAPRRFDFQYEVKSVWLGVMGYVATANTALASVREVTYTA